MVFEILSIIAFYIILFVIQTAVLAFSISMVYKVRFSLLRAFMVSLLIFVLYLLLIIIVAGGIFGLQLLGEVT